MSEETKDLLKRIQELREDINEVVQNKSSLIDDEVIGMSKTMDNLLNKLNKV